VCDYIGDYNLTVLHKLKWSWDEPILAGSIRMSSLM